MSGNTVWDICAETSGTLLAGGGRMLSGVARPLRFAVLLTVCYLLIACAVNTPYPTQAGSSAPLAERREFIVTSPQGNREDAYYWLRDDTREDPDVLAYLNAENAYTEAVMAPYASLRESIYQEIVSRLQQDESSPPTFHSGYWYYTRYEAGKDYAILARRKGSMDAEEEILLDQNQRAEGQAYYQLGKYSISPDSRYLAVVEDFVGRRQGRLGIKDLYSGQWLADSVANISADLAWADDSRTILYLENDPVTLQGKRVRSHTLGDSGPDSLVYEETDSTFFMQVSRSKSGQFLYIELMSWDATEVLYARADDPGLNFQAVLPRIAGHEYYVADHGDEFIIQTNQGAPNFRLVRAPFESSVDTSHWIEILPASEDKLIESFDVYRDFLAINLRDQGQRQIEVRKWSGGEALRIAADEAAYAASLIPLPEYGWPWLRYRLDTLTHPRVTYDFNVETGEKRIIKVEPVEGDFDPELYHSEYLHATARDGSQIPISLVYRKDLRQPGENPLLVYGYGSYGYSMSPRFSISRLSLLDRGFVYAIAHIRGGQEKGRAWYDQGKLENKMNTFTDFIDATNYLTAEGYGAGDKVFAEGGSAGGLLVGAVANMAPELYRGIVAEVPFVDVVTSMLDDSIPLSTNEYSQWGNPKYQPDYSTMLAYSPYDNVTAQDYPAMLITAGLWDSQVQYYEPAKWTARLRYRKTDDNWLLLRTNMDAGHGGQSGRYRQYDEVALTYAFILAQLDVSKAAQSLLD